MRFISLSLVAAAAIAGAAQVASAADVVAPKPIVAPAPIAIAAPVRTWTACYVGGNIGVGRSHDQVNDEVSGDPIGTLDATDIVGGGQIGCDYEGPHNWVIGIQGLWDATDLHASTTSAALGPLTLTGRIPWFATVTGRIGYALDPSLLLYAKGGAAWNHTDAKLTDAGTTIDSVGFNQTGWTAGGGLEWKSHSHWSMFVEYDYMGFKAQTVSFPVTTNIGRVHQNHPKVGLIGLNLQLRRLTAAASIFQGRYDKRQTASAVCLFSFVRDTHAASSPGGQS